MATAHRCGEVCERAGAQGCGCGLALPSLRSIKATAVSNALIDYREMGVRDYPVIRFRAVLDTGLPILLRHLATTFHVRALLLIAVALLFSGLEQWLQTARFR
jgi:hypothetical protein